MSRELRFWKVVIVMTKPLAWIGWRKPHDYAKLKAVTAKLHC